MNFCDSSMGQTFYSPVCKRPAVSLHCALFLFFLAVSSLYIQPWRRMRGGPILFQPAAEVLAGLLEAVLVEDNVPKKVNSEAGELSSVKQVGSRFLRRFLSDLTRSLLYLRNELMRLKMS